MARSTTRFRASTAKADAWNDSGREPLLSRLDAHPAVRVRGALTMEAAGGLASRVLLARDRWTPDFGGEQFALGRAFYTHLETGRAKEYFAGAAASDALVEAVVPGVPGRTLALLARLLGGEVRRRPGFCGPGVHVFPAGGKVAREGGVVHFDLEGLTEHQKARGHRAVTLVWMLQPAVFGGGLRLWDALFDGRPDSEIDAADRAHVTVRSDAGDARAHRQPAPPPDPSLPRRERPRLDHGPRRGGGPRGLGGLVLSALGRSSRRYSNLRLLEVFRRSGPRSRRPG